MISHHRLIDFSSIYHENKQTILFQKMRTEAPELVYQPFRGFWK